jgi:hypothetical protein
MGVAVGEQSVVQVIAIILLIYLRVAHVEMLKTFANMPRSL